MFGVYIDDAGNTGSDLDTLQQPFHFVGALLVPAEAWLAGREGLLDIMRSLPESVRNAGDFELHGYHAYRGQGPWRRMDQASRELAYSRCLALLSKMGMSLIYGCCDKKRLRTHETRLHPHAVGMWLCLEQVAEFLNQRGGQDIGFLVADNGASDINRSARQMLRTLRTAGPPVGKPVDMGRLIDDIHFMDSRDSLYLQLCDMALYAAKRWIVNRDPMNGLAARAIELRLTSRVFPH